MKKYLIIFLAYGISGILIFDVMGVIFRDTWYFEIREYLSALWAFAMLLHMGIAMQNRIVKRKYLIYLCVFYINYLAYFLLSLIIFNRNIISGSEMTPFDLIASNVLFVILAVGLIDIAKAVKNDNAKISRALYAIFGFLTTILIIINIVIIVTEL